MRRPLLVALSLCAGLLLGSAGFPANAADGAQGLTSSACEPRGSVTLVRGRAGRVFRVGEGMDRQTFGCLYDVNRAFALDDPFEGAYAYPPPAIRLTGPLVGYALEAPGNESPGATYVRVDDLHRDPLESDPVALARAGRLAFSQVGSLVLRRNGGVAWIACARRWPTSGSPRPGCVRPGSRNEVWKIDAGTGSRRSLDRGRGIDPRSLRRRGSRITWVKDGRRRSATLR